MHVRLILKFASEGFAVAKDETLQPGAKLYVAQTLAESAGKSSCLLL